MFNSNNNNTGKLVRFILRRDRLRISIWLISIILITIIIASAFTELYPTEADRINASEIMENPAMIAMVGQNYGGIDYTYGVIMAHQMLLFTALAVAIMSIFLVIRHTRGDEEGGRIEVIRSLPVGRLSNLSATGMVALGVNAILALIIGFGLSAMGIESMDLKGSLLYGVALGATGLFFAAMSALFSQLSDNSRGAVGYSIAFLGIAYLIRAIGDAGSEILSWFSPLGWILRTEVYVNNYWGPVLLTAGAAIAVFVLALYLNSIRDLDAGFIAAKPGRKTASIFLRSPLGLGLRLLRTAIIAWIAAMFILGASYGSVMGDIESFIGENEMYRQMLTGSGNYSLAEQFLPALISVVSMVSTIPVLIMITKLRSEEKRNRTEHLLARSVSRIHLMGSYFAISFAISFVVQIATALGLWSAAAGAMDDPFSLSVVFTAAMAYLPSIWIIIGVAMLFIGYLPQATGAVWLYLGYSFFAVYFGNVIQIPDWIARLSPFGYAPKMPVEDFSLAASLIMTAIAAVLIAIGFIGYNKRDVLV